MAISDAQWLDQQGRVRLVGQLDGDFGGVPEGWTQAVDESIVVTLVDPDVVPLAFKPPTGATADATDQIEVYDDTGNLVFFVDAQGNVDSHPATGGQSVLRNPSGAIGVKVAAAGVTIANGQSLGFYTATPVAQPAAPVTLGDVIAALKALGLVAT